MSAQKQKKSAIDIIDLTVAYKEKPVLWDIDASFPEEKLFKLYSFLFIYPFTRQFKIRLLTGNKSSQTQEKPDGDIRLNPNLLCCGSRSDFGDKQFNELTLLLRRKPTFSDVHRSYNNPLRESRNFSTKSNFI